MTHDTAADGARETRAVARLPGVDIAIIHAQAQEGRGESLTIRLQKTGVAPLSPFDPFGAWVQITQAAWAPWLALGASLWGIPRVLGRE